MLKRDITYENFDGETVTETFYFNLTKTEIITLEVGYEGGLQAAVKRIIEAKNNKELVAEFQRIVLMSYGVKSDDGKRFIKNEQIREEFSQTAAYDALFMELATSDEAAATFIKGVVPADISQGILKEQTAQALTVVTPPVPPVPPPLA